MNEEIINSKKHLNQIIKEILWDVPEHPFEFPHTILFKESFNSPMFKFTVDKIDNNFFIDEKGQKWVKS